MSKGKVMAKGQKQIVEENAATMRFYVTMMSVGFALHLLIRLVWSGDRPAFTATWILFALSTAAQTGALYCMRMMSRPTYAPDSHALLYGGLDLSMEGGVGEYCKDVVIFSTLVQLLTLFSSYMWSLLAVIPLYTSYKVWMNFLMPWFFAPAEDGSGSDKKRIKIRKKAQRAH